MQAISKFLAVLTIFLVSFFYLINNVNYLKSILNRENGDLSSQNQLLLTKLETKNNRGNNSFNLEIDKQTKSGDISLINPNNQLNILNLRKKDSSINVPSNNSETINTPSGSGLISR